MALKSVFRVRGKLRLCSNTQGAEKFSVRVFCLEKNNIKAIETVFSLNATIPKRNSADIYKWYHDLYNLLITQYQKLATAPQFKLKESVDKGMQIS